MTNLKQLFLPIVGNRPISQIKQRDITSFLDVACRKLPTNWRFMRGKTIQEILAGTYESHELASPGTFRNSYLATTRAFVEWCVAQYVDQGWPANITTKGIKYTGYKAAGESKQRSLSPLEIKRLFEGKEMAAFASDPSRAHMYWLPRLFIPALMVRRSQRQNSARLPLPNSLDFHFFRKLAYTRAENNILITRLWLAQLVRLIIS